MERVFWMNRNEEGLAEIGYPLSLKDLKKEFGDGKYFDVPSFLAGHPEREEEGWFAANDNFTIREVKDTEELLFLLTWEGFDHEESHASGCMDESYPDFVDKDLQLCRYIYEFTGYTDSELPVSGRDNETYNRYKKLFKLSDSDMEAEVTDLDQAKKDIADILHYGEELTKERYTEILKEYGLTQYLAKVA